MVKKIARAVKGAWKLREESYHSEGGEYKLTMEDAIVQAMQNQGVHADWFMLLDLAYMYPNDIQDWAQEILKEETTKDKCDQCQEVGLADPCNQS